MITLQGKNICERLKELNLKVKDAAENKVDLEKVNCVDNSDVDRIFKIDLASKYKNVDYVLEELKSGDSLYVSRALKCEWLYNNEYADLINPDYLHHHIFPYMSLKMKKKMLSTICINVRDETRAHIFYDYCMRMKMKNNALKFLIFTTESFKNELMNDDDSRFFDLCSEVEIGYFKNFIGDSFTLADTFGQRERPITELAYLYSLNEEKYLTLLEKHTKIPHHNKRLFGIKMSRSILKNHKDRVLKEALLYVNILNQKELVKNSTSEDALVYAVALLPDHEYMFWRCNYCRTYKHILDLIKTPSIFELIKNMFTKKYNSEFEMSKEFYENEYYDLMTFEERESWALRHLQEQLDVIPEDKNYKWYEFVTFAKSFEEIKSQIYTATNLNKRSDLLKVLLKSAKTQKDLVEVLNYYYKRHVNEKRHKKLSFIKAVMKYHRVLEFEDACWVAFDMLLHSLDIYNTSGYWGLDDILTSLLIYHIINNKPVPEGLQTLLKYDHVVNLSYLDHLNDEKKDLVYNFMNQFLINILAEFESQEYNDALKDKVRPYLERFLNIRRDFDKEEDKYPDIVLKYMKLDLEHFGHLLEEHKQLQEIQITEDDLMRCLKKDASLIVEKLPLVKDKFIRSNSFRIDLLLRRIKIFFSNDIAKKCVEFFTKTLYEYDSLGNDAFGEQRAIFSIVFAIFQMGDEKIKTEIMDKFAPTNPKIDHSTIGYFVLYTQEAICRFQSYSRPPVPLSKTALYLKGDYVHHCNAMFNMYLANLPPVQRTEFIKLLLDAPLSIQKRGLRLAFKTFEASELKDIISSVWKKTKNVSLRQIIYLLLLDKMVNEEGKTQEVLSELFKELTLTIHQDDANEIFACFSDYRIPTNLRGSYLETAWQVVARLPEKKSNYQRQISVINSITSNMSLMGEEFLERLINNHVEKILLKQKLCPEVNNDIAKLNVAMWDFIAQYIVDVTNETKQEKSLKLVETITKECFDHWNEDYNTSDLIFQVFFRNFVDGLITHSSRCDTKYRNVVHILEYLLDVFEKQFGISEMYTYFWDWKLRLMMEKAINGHLSSDKEVCINFGWQLGIFIKELKDKNLCYISFFSKIVEKISCCVYDFHFENSDPSLDDDDVSILVACGLTQTKMFETYLLALDILPLNPTEILKTEYLEVIKKIKEENNAELTAFMNDKFIYSDLKVREFIM